MEFRWAAEGNTEELRQWLRAHPERVDVPAKGSHMTLLYTCISNSNRTDLASLQAGYSRYLSTVRMLCEEYKANVLAPNGGSYNTALHLAATLGATSIVRYLVEVLRTPIDCANAFGERPVQLAERHGHSECASILAAAAAAAAASIQGEQPAGQRTVPLRTASSDGLQGGSAGALAGENGRFVNLTVSDSDDGEESVSNGDVGAPAVRAANGLHGEQAGHPTSAPSPPTQLMQHCDSGISTALSVPSVGGSSAGAVAGAAQPPLRHRNLNGAGASGTPGSITPGAFVMVTPSNSAARPALPMPVRPRQEYDISNARILANPDLQGFRFAYGDGFRYIQCRDHYEIRGILPYTYRGTVYYTPVIISVYAPALTTDSSEGTASGILPVGGGTTDAAANGCEKVSSFIGPASANLSQAASPASHAATKIDVYCRYRVCLNMQSLNNFAISRKAEYLDPISGAIIPAPGDDKYQTLTAYIRNVVVRNFEAVPPLIVPTSSYAFPLRPNVSQLGSSGSADAYQHHHSHSAPAFMKDALPNRSAAHIRCAAILRDLSRFGDGLARYFPEKHRIVAYVPIFSEHKVAVLAIPQERPYATTVGQSPPPATSKASLAEIPVHVQGGKADVTQQVAAKAVVELQVRVLLQFSLTRIGGAAGESDAANGCETGMYAYPPRIYLVDAATRPLAALLDGTKPSTAAVAGTPPPAPSTLSLTAQCFAGMIKDKDTGEVLPELLRLSQESWSASGSVFDILVELQRALRGVLESFAMSYADRKSVTSLGKLSSPSAAAGDHTTGTPRKAPAAPSALDSFFTTQTAQAQPTRIGARGHGSDATQRSSAGYCLFCVQPLQPSCVLLQPCGHDGICGLCVQRLQSHCREEVFSCPVCRGAVRNVMEVFL
ncbi:hypothetical protein LSCM1_08232 [Leishmania martiniquensis]|uniref:RING-type domain-containing protein n=1 Tax=Leishmania martiniquensis TaxID=1580590 RepID=A0A836GTJ2_9TRYP|nr:hypothetical protein LSCM1_08232 [Leishmania martiniquensis]